MNKFRIWDKRKRKMWYSGCIWLHDDGSQTVWAEHCGRDTDDFLVLWFTGLKDKSGREIYEGDICTQSTRGGDKVRGEVKFDVFRGIVIGKWPIFRNVEVIGNIYENPELLKV